MLCGLSQMLCAARCIDNGLTAGDDNGRIKEMKVPCICGDLDQKTSATNNRVGVIRNGWIDLYLKWTFAILTQARPSDHDEESLRLCTHKPHRQCYVQPRQSSSGCARNRKQLLHSIRSTHRLGQRSRDCLKKIDM